MIERRFAWMLLPALLGLATASQAQFLRAGGSTLVVSPLGNDSDTAELGWSLRPDGVVVSRTTSSAVGGAQASMSFAAGFGLLRSALSAEVVGVGPMRAQAAGTFASFNNFVGAAFFDRITLDGAGPVSLRIGTSLHSVLGAPDSETHAEVQLKVDAFSVGVTPLWRVDQSPIVHEGAGERRTASSFIVNGTAGQSFDLLVELSSLVSASTPAGQLGVRRAFADASHTGLVTITALSGSFASASGATYVAPVPEPATYISMAVGLALLGWRLRGRAGPVAAR